MTYSVNLEAIRITVEEETILEKTHGSVTNVTDSVILPETVPKPMVIKTFGVKASSRQIVNLGIISSGVIMVMPVTKSQSSLGLPDLIIGSLNLEEVADLIITKTVIIQMMVISHASSVEIVVIEHGIVPWKVQVRKME